MMAESAIMLALATVLSIFKLYELPYGGSITIASMLPLLIIAYRYGTGLGSCHRRCLWHHTAVALV